MSGNNDVSPVNESDQNSDEEDQLLLKAGSDKYANIATLSKYIPELNPSHDRAKTLRVKLAKRTTMLKIQSASALTIVLLNLVLAVWAFSTSPPDSKGIGTFSFGNCERINNINGVLHLLLNVVSSLFLGAGNYCMQILVAPSREEIDRAHSRGVSLTIGVPNVKNLKHIERRRVIFWLMIATFATLLHIFWNSAIFISIPHVSYPRAVVTSDFLETHDDWCSPSSSTSLAPDSVKKLIETDNHPYFFTWNNWPTKSSLQPYQNKTTICSLRTESSNFTYLDKRSCIDNFIDPLNSTRSVIVVASNITSEQNSNSSLYTAWLTAWDAWNTDPFWICHAYETNLYFKPRWCGPDWANTFADEWVVAMDTINHEHRVAVDHCLVGEAGDNSERCGLHYSAYILVIVCVSTLAGGLLVLWTWLDHRRHSQYIDSSHSQFKENRLTLVTMGDAIADFLRRPDTNHAPTESWSVGPIQTRVVSWSSQDRTSWFKVLGGSTWAISLTLFLAGLVIPSVGLAEGLKSIKSFEMDIGISSIWSRGFQTSGTQIVHQSFFLKTSEKLDLLGKVLFANGFQLLVSFLYIFYNNILTRQLLADEWVRFTRPGGKKPLRVSSPVGMQRSSYTLSLPMAYSVPLIASFVLLHWLVSRGVFLIRITMLGPGPNVYRILSSDQSSVGYSPLGIIFCIILGSILIFALLANSLIRHHKGVPPRFASLGSESAAISGVCQPPEEDTHARFFPVSMGIVKDGISDSFGADGRLTFSTFVDLQAPENGGKYLQVDFAQRASREEKFLPAT